MSALKAICPNLTKFSVHFNMLTVAVDRSSSDNNAIRYVLLVTFSHHGWSRLNQTVLVIGSRIPCRPRLPPRHLCGDAYIRRAQWHTDWVVGLAWSSSHRSARSLVYQASWLVSAVSRLNTDSGFSYVRCRNSVLDLH